MITRVRIQNYRSFVDAEVKLRPFSLVVGANGSGKSNFLRFFEMITGDKGKGSDQDAQLVGTLQQEWQRHINRTDQAFGYSVFHPDGLETKGVRITAVELGVYDDSETLQKKAPVFSLIPEQVSMPEPVIASTSVSATGAGTAQVLESLKSGDREDLFDSIEGAFKRYVPEVEKLSLRTVEKGKKQIQVREKGLKEPLAATELSEGTRLVLCILTILHQENPPPIILLEDIDRGLHPRLFEYVAPMMKDIAERHQINIIATTHNPYLVDCFQDDKEAVIIVEKKDGASTLTTLADKLEGIDYDKVDPDDMPLGNLWFSGLVGGVPRIFNRRPNA